MVASNSCRSSWLLTLGGLAILSSARLLAEDAQPQPQEQPQPEAQTPENPLKFIEENVKRFHQELQDLKARYENNCGPLPSADEKLFSGLGLPLGETVSVRVERSKGTAQFALRSGELRQGVRNLIGGLSVTVQLQAAGVSLGRREGLSTGFGSTFFAGDDFSADLLGMARSFRISVSATIVEVEKKEYTYYETRKDPETGKTVTIEKKAIGDFVTGGKQVSEVREFFPGSITLSTEGPAELNDATNGTRVYVTAPGKVWVKARAHEAFDGIDQSKHPYAAKTTSEKEGMSQPIECVLIEFKQIGLEGVDLGGKAPAMDLFNPQAGLSYLELSPRLVVSNGAKEATIEAPPDKMQIDVKSGSVFTVKPARYHNLIAAYRGGFGKTEFALSLGSADTRQETSQTYAVTANQARLEIDPPLTYGEALIAGENYTVSAIVEGEAVMSQYVMAWNPLDVQAEWSGSSEFQEQADGLWVAKNNLRVGTEELEGWNSSNFKTAVLDWDSRKAWRFGLANKAMDRDSRKTMFFGGVIQKKNSKEPVYTTPPIRASHLFRPRMTSIKLFARAVGDSKPPVQAPTQFDLLAESTADAKALECFLDLEFKDGTKFTNLKAEDVPWLAVIDIQGQLMGTTTVESKDEVLKVAKTGIDGTGKTELVAVANAAQARGFGVPFLDDKTSIESDPITVTVNRLLLSSSELPDNRTIHQLSVFGGADMSQYQAKFDFRFLFNPEGRLAAKMGFTKKQSQVFSASAEEPTKDTSELARTLDTVTVIDKDGAVVAEIKAGSRAAFRPKVVLKVPSTAPINGRVVISAFIQDLPAEFWKQSTCRWLIDPAFGAFMNSETAVEMETPKRGRSVATLDMANQPRNVDRSAPVTVELVLRAD